VKMGAVHGTLCTIPPRNSNQYGTKRFITVFGSARSHALIVNKGGKQGMSEDLNVLV
jgi:hypothetical protein